MKKGRGLDPLREIKEKLIKRIVIDIELIAERETEILKELEKLKNKKKKLKKVEIEMVQSLL